MTRLTTMPTVRWHQNKRRLGVICSPIQGSGVEFVESQSYALFSFRSAKTVPLLYSDRVVSLDGLSISGLLRCFAKKTIGGGLLPYLNYDIISPSSRTPSIIGSIISSWNDTDFLTDA